MKPLCATFRLNVYGGEMYLELEWGGFIFFHIFDMILMYAYARVLFAESPAIQMVSYINMLSKIKQFIFIAQQMLIR